MKWKDWLENWGMASLKIKTPFLESTWEPQDADKDAAWDLYMELLTRVSTQSLNLGDEQTALSSIHSLFPTTRGIIRHHGRKAGAFTRLAIVVLNQIIRPFTEKWHPVSLAGGFNDPEICDEFRRELSKLQLQLTRYTQALADLADVEDLTTLES